MTDSNMPKSSELTVQLLKEVNLSVKELVNFYLKSGDLSRENSYYGERVTSRQTRALQGIEIHKKIQAKRPASYEREVTVRGEFLLAGIKFVISGRIDGVICPLTVKEESVSLDDEYDSVPPSFEIEEIKSIQGRIKNCEEIEEARRLLDWGQAKVYAYLYAHKLIKEKNISNLNCIVVSVIYCEVKSLTEHKESKFFKYTELEKEFVNYLTFFADRIKLLSSLKEKRDQSLKLLKFPYLNFRTDQRKMAIVVYKTIAEQKVSFIEAPTGIGKTIGHIFPALKAMGEGKVERIFYLTAKSSGKEIAERTLIDLYAKGASLLAVTITAKSKICFSPLKECDSETCEYAKGYFDRLQTALSEILSTPQLFSREKIENFGKKYKLCPFELSLDISSYSDLIIGDYNYIFDPQVKLARHLESSDPRALLIDEAHNLVERVREMYSISINSETLLKVRRKLRFKSPILYKALGRITSALGVIDKEILNEKQEVVLDKLEQLPEKFILAVLTLGFDLEAGMEELKAEVVKEGKETGGEELEGKETEIKIVGAEDIKHNESKQLSKTIINEFMEQYLEIHRLVTILEYFDQHFKIIIRRKAGKDMSLKIYCLDPAHLVEESLSNMSATIFFSATLTPLHYFKNGLIPSHLDPYILKLSSPFPVKNCKPLVAAHIDTRYEKREDAYSRVTDIMHSFFSSRPGKYLIFFPAYKFLEKVYQLYTEKFGDKYIIKHLTSLSEEEQKNFIDTFHIESENEIIPQKVLGLTVIGGHFAESVDLKGESLIGVMIIGVGLPAISTERELIREHFDEKWKMGFEYAYKFPGVNRVLQAAGRLIRSEDDKGIIVFCDQRYTQHFYLQYLREKWSCSFVNNNKQADGVLKNLWSDILGI